MATSAQDLITTVLDRGTFFSWDTPAVDVHPSSAYAEELARARERTGRDEAVLTGEGRIRGVRVALVSCEADFLGGSVGVASAERVVAAVERATALRLPLLATPASGGTRMQEGTIAFLQMVKITAAVARHKQAGLPYLVYLRDPTMGGVFASWGSLGHVTAAEPGARVGFLGPRVYRTLHGEDFPEGVQTAENLFAHGLIDGVVPVRVLRLLVHRALRVMSGDTTADPLAPMVSDDELAAPPADVSAWESVQASRAPGRPGVRSVLRHCATDHVPLSGTGQGESDHSLLLSLARLRGYPCVVVGQDDLGGRLLLGPAALRSARRGMRLAAELRLPLVLMIDTWGAALSQAAEEGGLAGEIARCMADLVTLPVPTISVLLGQGTGGGALAMLPADRVLCAQHAWLAPLPPEGASAVVHRTPDRAEEMAELQGIRSADLLRDGVVDRVIPERPDASVEPDSFATRVGLAISEALADLSLVPADIRATRRLDRYRRLGLPDGD
ncbi:carboxyl transferase domain-containing protein [Tsukamurella sp. 8F]|uniref:carboxyl transferase domain-containing protein n=1 Tax=unclassified Tsukamurella TaxID=2633480 RepID=UPI0023B9FB3B|nr:MULTISPECIES: carboxyl transferase domain-containing protein [unclassified Tsukamurella]MDF0529800.1 carboxyl transferase domain-containing protein [Tsukamurella sp. 8J]MDF0586992.1 carboxyl transferase domain-containing protein [Tsukamurella sp. 8F]